MNILILSAGTRNKIIQYFRETLSGHGNIIAADMSELAPALYEADKYYLTPSMSDPEYLSCILEICEKEKIDGIISLIDPELSLLAKYREQFEKAGVTVIGSDYDLCEQSLDKYQMYLWLREHNYSCAKSWVDFNAFKNDLKAGNVSFPVFVKPVRGSASINISKVNDYETLDFLMHHNSGLMIQEFLDGQEIGADVYIDMISGEVISIFTKKKIRMRSGETDKAVSFKNDELFALIKGFVKEAGYRGQIDIDIMDINGTYYISEVNPRFGGGYPHAYACGCNHMEYIIHNLNGQANTPVIGRYDENVYMMKYSEITVLRKNS